MRSPYLHINYDDFNIIIKKLQIILLNLIKTYILILKFSYKESNMKTVIVTGRITRNRKIHCTKIRKGKSSYGNNVQT